MLNAVDRVEAALDHVQFAGVKAVGVQAVGQLGGQVAGAIVQVVEAFGQRGQRFVQPGAVLQALDRAAQQVGGTGLFTVLVPCQRQVGGGDAVQNALGVGDDGLALLQVFLLTGLQCGGIDGVDFSGQCFDLALLVGLAGIEGVQLALDGDQLAVAAVVICKQITVLGILVQQTQVQGRIRQALAVVLAVDGQQPCGNIPHDGGGSGHAVDAAAALALGVDLAVQKQVVGDLVAAFFQLLFDGGRDTLKRCPDARLLCAASHQLTRGAVA